MKDYSCELGAACGPEAAAGRELAAVRKRRCVAEEAQVAGEGDERLLLLFKYSLSLVSHVPTPST